MESLVAEAGISALLESLAHGLFNVSQVLLNFGKKQQITATEITKWYQMLGDLRAVLQDAEERQSCNSGIRVWLADLTDLAYDVEDMLEEMEYERSKQVKGSIWVRWLKMLLRSFSLVPDDLQEITLRMQDMIKRKEHLNLLVGTTSVSISCPVRPLEGSISIEPIMYGREREEDEIIDLLLRPNNGNERVGIIPIVGMGGIGKTTLAQHVFKDDRVVRCFEVRAWVCVSMDFDKSRVYNRIVEAVTSISCGVQDPCSIEDRVQSELRDKKFLIILDDLWNENIFELEKLFGPFQVGAPDSKVVITTRNLEIANRVKTVNHCIELPCISDEHCWFLFCSHARLDRESELATIGKEITKRCAGIPLAAAIMGGLLRGNENEEHWKAALNDSSLISERGNFEIMSVLKMSYNHLPDYLKRCFLFCTMFPEDFEFSKDFLVPIWVSIGLVKFGEQGKNWKDMEDLGGCYFNELVSRSLLSKCDNEYVMHDLIRDMGKKILGNSYCRWESSMGSLEKMRYLTVDRSIITQINESCLKLKEIKVLPLRTFLVFDGVLPYLTENRMDNLFSKAKKLRVLSIDECCILEIPRSIGQMIHLRYLHISESKLVALPSEIGNLVNLQTLQIYDCKRLVGLPSEIGNLVNLQLLLMWKCERVTTLPSEIGNVVNLQHLLINGCLSLMALPSEIGNLVNLQRLVLVGCMELKALPSEIGNLRSLKTLNISNCEELERLPSKIGSLINLQCLEMRYCEGLRVLPSTIGNLKNLEELDMSNCKGITELPSEIGNLFNLKILNISNCKELARCPLDISNLNNLRYLYMDHHLRAAHQHLRLPSQIELRKPDYTI